MKKKKPLIKKIRIGKVFLGIDNMSVVLSNNGK